jgi:hypothetical protein
MIVAIHQPNYAPWLGYFAKMARADVFVLLDDAQFSKNSYINRVQVDARGKARWLTVPVTYKFGDPVNRVRCADPNWPRSHGDTLKTLYARAPAFGAVWPWLAERYAALPTESLAAGNEALIAALAGRLGLKPVVRRASEIDIGDAARGAGGDDKLVALVRACGAGASYLSGRGGANYQDPAKFAAAGIRLVYSEFVQPRYAQGHEEFVPGLSVLDALFRLGWDETAAIMSRAAIAA